MKIVKVKGYRKFNRAGMTVQMIHGETFLNGDKIEMTYLQTIKFYAWNYLNSIEKLSILGA